MSRLLALDIGAARTGVALSDELGLTARALETVPSDALAARLAELVDEYAVKTVVVGRPRSLDGSLGAQVVAVEEAVENLRDQVAAEFVYEDETGTTKESDGTDADAARVILEGYLNEHRS